MVITPAVGYSPFYQAAILKQILSIVNNRKNLNKLDMDFQSSNQFRQKTITGIEWNVISALGRNGQQFIIGVILARLLSPADFGLISMIMVFVGFASILQDFGFVAALIQKQDLKPSHYHSVFWINILIGFLLMGLFIFLSPTITGFYNLSVLRPMTYLISSRLLVRSLGLVQSSILLKRLDFKKMAIIDLISMAIAGVIGITMAFLGYGVWSLVWQSILHEGLKTILLWYRSDWKPAFQIEASALKDLWKFSFGVMGFSGVNYLLRNGDNLLIGRFLGEADLGIYSKSYGLLLMPMRLVSNTIKGVLFPAISQIQDDKTRIASIYLRFSDTVALITFPMMIGLGIIAEDFVLAVFGCPWANMIPILRVFCFVGLIQSIEVLNVNLYLSQGKSTLRFIVGTLIGVIGLIAIAIGLKWGIEGVAYAYGIFSFFAFYPRVKIAVSLIDLKFSQVISNLAPTFLYSAVMGLFVWLVRNFLLVEITIWIRLGIQILLGSLVYFLIIHFARLRAYIVTRDLLLEQIRRRF